MTFIVTKRVLLAGLALGISSISFAAKNASKDSGKSSGRKYGMAGCGLGSMIIEPSGSQTSAATTNGVAYSQLFGITSGTSNCEETKEVAAITSQETFVATNLTTLSKQIAQGEGDLLAAFSTTLGCPSETLPTVATELKSNFAEIFKAPGAMAVLDTSKDILRANPIASANCLYLN